MDTGEVLHLLKPHFPFHNVVDSLQGNSAARPAARPAARAAARAARRVGSPPTGQSNMDARHESINEH